MSDLRAQLIKLAYHNKALRPHVLPLLSGRGKRASSDVVFQSAEMLPDQMPDALDEDFIVPYEVKFILKGKTLARIMGKQQRVLGQSLDPIKFKERAFLNALKSDGQGILLGLTSPIQKLVKSDLYDEHDLLVKIENIEWASDITDFWYATPFPRREEVHVLVDVDVTGYFKL